MRNLYEGILDSDKKIIDDAKKEVAHQWIDMCCKCGQNKLTENEDYTIDDNGNISIFGDCTLINISSSSPKLRDLNSRVKIICLEPNTPYSRVIVRDPEAASKILPLSQIGDGSKTKKFVLIYNTKEDLEPRHFPMLVHGSVVIEQARKVNLCIMPNCTESLTIYETGCSSIKYPAGFPVDAKTINICK